MAWERPDPDDPDYILNWESPENLQILREEFVAELEAATQAVFDCFNMGSRDRNPAIFDELRTKISETLRPHILYWDKDQTSS